MADIYLDLHRIAEETFGKATNGMLSEATLLQSKLSVDDSISGSSTTLEHTLLQEIFARIKNGKLENALSLIPQLDNIEYERNRKEIANLANMRASALDALRKKPSQEQEKQGRALSLPEPVPASEPQDGVKLLNDVATQVRRFIVANAVNIDAITLWIVFAHIAQKASVCPNLVFSSAVKACGKSTALDVVSRLVPKPLSVASISVAALFRTVELLSPTLLIDEADAMFKNNDDLRTLINAGFTKSAAEVVRIVGDDFEPRTFNIYTPKAIALIGTLPDTIESRSVIIRMRRRLPDEQIERLRSDRDQDFAPLALRVARWTLDNAEKILAQEPEIDPTLSDRQADVWRELLRIADTAGGEWPQRARIAAIELCEKQSDEGDLSVRLLADIQRIFSEQPERTKWPSQLLVNALNALEEAPLCEVNHGKELTTNRLARMLARFEIKTCTLRDGSKTPKGYSADSFNDVFSRYLPQNRNTATNADNSILENEIKCCGNVSVADVKRNIDDAEGEAMESDNFTNTDLEIVACVFQRLIETNKNGLCLANWRLSCAAEGVPFETFDAAKKYYDQLEVYRHISRGVITIGKPETQEAEFVF